MKIGLLLCDVVDPEESERTGGYPKMFCDLLRLADPEASVAEYDVTNGIYPADIDECDSYIVTGSRHGVYDGLPWLDILAEYVRKLYKQRKPTVGICFGHQMIAQALGGSAGKSDKGWGLGIHEAKVSNTLDWTEGANEGRTVSFLVCHQDQVHKLPPRASRFLASDFCPNAGFTVDECVFCLQGHPEFDRDYMRYLIGTRGKDLAPEEVERLLASLDLQTDAPLASCWIRDFVAKACS